MVRHDFLQAVAKLGLLQSQHALVDLLLQHLSGVFIVHEFAHARREKALVVEVFEVTLALVAFLRVLALQGLLLLAVGCGLLVQQRVRQELFLNHSHAHHDGRGISVLNYIDTVVRKVNLLLTALAEHWLRRLGSEVRLLAPLLVVTDAVVLLAIAVLCSEVVLEHAHCSLWLGSVEHRVLTSLRRLDHALRLRLHLARVLELVLEANDYRQHVGEFLDGSLFPLILQ